jgi:hypothetical protein
MHESRNFALILILVAAIAWTFVAWLLLDSGSFFALPQRVASILLVLSVIAWLIYALSFEDKIDARMHRVVGDVYYNIDGLSIMPIIRVHDDHAEICVYYQNRFENPVQAIVHLRPPPDSFIIRPGVQDVHFAFIADGGDFGVIHQPIAVPRHLQGELIEVQLAAASYYPRSHGARLLKHSGLSCGSFNVDWGGAAFKSGVHEISGEIELFAPAILHFTMPSGVRSELTSADAWRQERLSST